MYAVVDTALFDPVSFDSQLADTKVSISVFRQALKQADEELTERFFAGRSASELVYARARVIDELLVRAWRHFFDPDAADIALIAVGGYGRGELHPRSDIDLLILARKTAKKYKDPITQFLTFVWDIGLEVGHSVRSVDECVKAAKSDITIATNLQEARLLFGPQALFDLQQKKCHSGRIWPSKQFFAAKYEEQRDRHIKFNDTAYNLEPNIKEGPGGLRDIQMIGWVAKRHFNSETLHDLVKHEFLTEDEYQALIQGQAFLWRIRFGLHILSNRREDRLLFDHQRALARHFGYQDDPKRLGVEKFMKEYYRTIKELARLNEMLLQLFQEEILFADKPGAPVAVNNRFQARRGFLEIKDESVFRHYPFALLEVFLLMAQHGELKGVRANTIRAIRDHRYLIDAEFRRDLRCRSLFMEILRQPVGVTHELRRMHRYGVLAAYLPLFGDIVGQMQHDLFHVYTVDEHILMVIRNIRRLTVEKFKDELPLCSQLMQSIPKQELLIIAALFHDIAKGRGGDHSELGKTDAETFCRDHGLGDYDTRLVRWLVEVHLLMSTTAQRKDISDPDVINEFATEVGDQTHLNYLYLLTVSDIRATNPELWNSWKDALLKELYFTTKRAMRRGLDNPLVVSDFIRENKQQSLRQLEETGVSADAVETLWERLGDEYFLRYSPHEVVAHTRALLDFDDANLPLILIRERTPRGGTEIFIYTRAHDHLFAQATAVLEQLALNVVDARILTSQDGYSLDSFIVLDHNDAPLSDPQQLETIRERLNKELNRLEKPTPAPNEHLPRQAKHFTFTTEVQFWEDSSLDRTAMQVTAYDRPGLLSHIAKAFVHCQVRLQNAKIATFGERAEDIFYVTTYDDEPLTDPAQFQCLRDKIGELLD
jgi:[protein-PII] uridylyltransferase